MLKITMVALALIIVGSGIIRPLQYFITDLIRGNKAGSEVQFIGAVSRYNPKVKEVQQILKDSNLDPGSVDGLMGARTRVAIREYQKASRLRPTGIIDSATWSALNKEKKMIRDELKTNIPVARINPEANIYSNEGR